MMPMLVVCQTLWIYIFKMEQAFNLGNQEGDKILYVCPTNWQGVEETTLENEVDQDDHWKPKNYKSEKKLHLNLDPQMRWNKIFLVWDGNHCLQAWLPYVNMVH